MLHRKAHSYIKNHWPVIGQLGVFLKTEAYCMDFRLWVWPKLDPLFPITGLFVLVICECVVGVHRATIDQAQASAFLCNLVVRK